MDWPPLTEKGATGKVCNLQLATHQGCTVPVSKSDLPPDSLLLAYSSVVSPPAITFMIVDYYLQRQLITRQWVAKTKIGKAVAWAQQRKKLAQREVDWDDMALTLYLIQEKHNTQSNWLSFFIILRSTKPLYFMFFDHSKRPFHHTFTTRFAGTTQSWLSLRERSS